MEPVSTAKPGRANTGGMKKRMNKRMRKLHAAGSGALALASLLPTTGVAQTYDAVSYTHLTLPTKA